MTNISLNGEQIKLKPHTFYYIIDALYITDIKGKLDELNSVDIEKQLREKVFAFPNTDLPFAKYYTHADSFSIEQIKQVNYNDVQTKDSTYFATDTGLLIIVKADIILDFSKEFDYEDVINSDVDLFNKDYWNNIASKYDANDLALIIAPGVGSGFDLQGSGTYRVI